MQSPPSMSRIERSVHKDVGSRSPGESVAASAHGPMNEPVCTPGHHLGDDGGGHCSVCNARLTRRDLALVGLLLMTVSMLVVLAIIAVAIRWVLG
jgi:hypothetical protein